MICCDCGAPYSDQGVDLVLPDQQWKGLFPEGEGFLCANCICVRARSSGATAVLAWVANMTYDNHKASLLSSPAGNSTAVPAPASPTDEEIARELSRTIAVRAVEYKRDYYVWDEERTYRQILTAITKAKSPSTAVGVSSSKADQNLEET